MPEPETEPGRTAAEVATAQARVAGRLLDVLLDPVQADTYVRGVLPAPDGAPAVRVVTGTSAAGLEDASLWQVPLPVGEPDPGEWVLGVLTGLFAQPVILLPASRLTHVSGLPMVDVDPREVVPGASTAHHRTLPLLRGLAAPAPAGEPDVRLRGFWLTGDSELRIYLQPAGRPAEAGPVAVDVAREADAASVRRAVSGEERHTPLLGDPHCTGHLDLVGA
ncbi:hypothetical protein ACH5AU_09350 [Streptomyces albidoflavus]